MILILNDKQQIIAMTESKKVAKKYKLYEELSNKDEKLSFIKVKNKDPHVRANDDLYLVRYGDTYIQKGYIQYLDMANNQFDEDEQFAMDIILRMLELKRVSKKESRKLKEATLIIEKYRRSDSIYTPSLQQLKTLKDQFDPYMHHMEGGEY